VKLTVFKGREAKLNRTIFLILGKKEPQTTRALFKAVTQIRSLKNTSYSTVNKRVRNLEELGFLKKVIVKQRLGGITNFYELRPKAYLSKFFDSASIEDLIKQTNDKTALIVLGTLIGTK
jgi:predicted transcriptional regulator